MTRREDLAWAAGFFDGEGTIGYRVRRTSSGTACRSLDLAIAQSDPERLHRFVTVVGVGRVRGPYQAKIGRPYHQLAVAQWPAVQHVVASLWPWLGPIKREQAHRALSGWLAFVPDVALCEHGEVRQRCTPCRSTWMTRSWAERKAIAQ